MRPTYEELQTDIKKLELNIKAINEEMSLSDNEYELAKLVMELESYENQLTFTEEVLERGLSRVKDILNEK